MLRTSLRRAIASGVLAGLLTLAVIGGLAYAQGRLESPRAVVLVLAGPAEDTSDEARFVYLIDLARSTARVEVIDPFMKAPLSGTSNGQLREVYAFGGGEAVAEALAAERGGARPAHVTLPFDAWTKAVDTHGGIDIDVPDDMHVLAGGEMHSLRSGTQRLSGEEINALLLGLDYVRPKSSRRPARIEAAGRVAKGLLGDGSGATAALSSSLVDTSLGNRALARLKQRLGSPGRVVIDDER